MGASSGIGHEVARQLINEGWTVGVAARRIEKLTDLQNSAPERVFTAQIDVTEEHADASLSVNNTDERNRPLSSRSGNRMAEPIT